MPSKTGSVFRHSILALLLLLSFLSEGVGSAHDAPSMRSAAGGSPYQVHVAYIIPSDRKPIANYRTKTGALLTWIQAFYADQMERNGFGRMTFDYEKASDGLPAVVLIHSPMTAAEFAGTGHAKYTLGDYWLHAESALKGAGHTAYRPGEIWLCFAEAQDQLADGSIHNLTFQGNCRFGSGMTLCSANALALADPKLLHDHRSYDGLTLPEFGPHRLTLHKSFPDYEGDTVSTLAAVQIGAVAHEMGHAFTLQHCLLSDLNFNGNLMGNSFRGWRGVAMPEQFPKEETRLDRPSALMLRVNPFFRKPTEVIPEVKPPVVTLSTPAGPMPIEQGRFRLPFTVSQPDGPGIACAILQCAEPQDNVGVVSYQEFDGTNTEVEGTFETSMVTPGKEQHWTVRVFDKQGRWGEQTVLLKAPAAGLAAIPFISLGHSTVKVGEPVNLDAGLTRGAGLRFHWDFGDDQDADGQTTTHTYKKPGVYEIKLTVRDASGNRSEISQYLWVRKPGSP